MPNEIVIGGAEHLHLHQAVPVTQLDNPLFQGIQVFQLLVPFCQPRVEFDALGNQVKLRGKVVKGSVGERPREIIDGLVVLVKTGRDPACQGIVFLRTPAVFTLLGMVRKFGIAAFQPVGK